MEDNQHLPSGSAQTELVLKTMLDKDSFSEWLGVTIDEFREGYCKLHFTIRQDMLNGFSIVHGGVVFSAADSAFAFACNSHGRLSVALDAHISFISAAKAGDVLVVEAKEVHTGNKASFYNVTVSCADADKMIAVFKGTAYRTSKMVYGNAI